MKNINALRKLSEKDLRDELLKAQKGKMKLRFEAKTGQLAGAHKLKTAKTYVAQIRTVQSENRGSQASVESKKDAA